MGSRSGGGGGGGGTGGALEDGFALMAFTSRLSLVTCRQRQQRTLRSLGGAGRGHIAWCVAACHKVSL